MEQHYYSPVETAPLDEIRALQSYRLLKTVRHIYDHVPFYRNKFDELGLTPEDIKTVDDVSKLPFTYKQDLRDNYPYGLFAVPQDQVVRVHASSGTTGKQTVVGYTQRDLDVWGEIIARAISAAGGTKHDFVHISYGYGLFTGGLGLHQGATTLGASVIPVSTGNTKRQIQIMQDFGSDILCCTPSYAMYMGETIRDMGIDPNALKLRAGIFGAEPWSEEMRKKIEELLAIKAYDIYGLSEIMGPGVSYECSEQTGMHVNEDHFIVEVIDPDTGEVLPEGSWGELVFTCITKEALPLIRYRTRDIGFISRKKCSCGRTFVKMSKPNGRTDDMLIIRGVNVFPSQIESVLLQFPDITPNYLLIVDREGALDSLEIQVEMAEGAAFDAVRLIEKREKEISGAVESILGIAATIHLVSPKTLARSEGKAQRVIDKRKL
ncbi:MAG: phenylacetate-CoA ligase [Oscillospiraceae bacterium]|nr:phenylacetate-CoA ligase [Oscillospiraceae bacterium]